MAYVDPQTVTINSVPQVMARTSMGLTNGVFRTSDGNHILEVTHQLTKAKRVRSTIKLTERKIATDPLISSQSIQYSTTASFTFDRPETGFTVAELKLVADGFFVWLTASSGAKVTQLLGQEN